jgi:glycosyltransferase involved in cell wall biosynthesis
MDLSIIIPTYKVELWIEKCLLSIVRQNIDASSYEIIVVNDESPDQSADIARTLAKEYPQISVIDQKNKGLSGARNTGIRHAKGKYLLFIDSDDYLEPNVLKDMLFFAESNELEIAMFGQNMVINEVKNPRDKYNPETTTVMSGMELFYKRTSDSACKYLILTEFLRKNSVYFFEQAVYLEDGEWSPRIFVKAKRAAYKGIYFYNYVLRGNSLVTSGVAVTQKALEGYLKSANNLIDFQFTPSLNDKQKQFINQTIAKFVLLPITLSATKKGLKQITHIRRTILKAGFSNLDTVGVVGMRLKHVRLYNKSFYLFYVYLLLKNTFSFIK